MFRALVSLILAPFWVQLLLAAGLGYGGYFMQNLEKTHDAQMSVISQQAQPAILPIEDFKRTGAAVDQEEVNLRAQWIPSKSIQLVQQNKTGGVKHEYMLHLFFAADAGASKQAVAGVIVPISRVGQFRAWSDAQMANGGEQGPLGPILTLEGLRDSPAGTDLAIKGMEKYHQATTENFFYIEPFYSGREAGIAFTPRNLDVLTYYYPAFVLLGFAVFKLLLGLMIGKKPKSQTLAAKTPVNAPFMPELPATATPAPITAARGNGFIGALSGKKAEAAPTLATSAIVSSRSLTDRFGGNLGGFAKKIGMGFVALLVYFGMMNLSPDAKLMNLMGPKTSKTAIEAVEAKVVTATLDGMGGSTGATPELAPVQVPVGNLSVERGRAEQKIAKAMAEPVIAGQGTQTQLQTQVAGVAAFIAGLRAMFAAPPLWFMISVLGCVIFLPAVFLLNRMAPRGAKAADFDPFERLMQRRLAEQARAEKKGATFQRA